MGKGKRARTRRISYEIVPGALFARPVGLKKASFAVRARAQRRAEQLFQAQLLKAFDLRLQKVGEQVVHGGWQGAVNPSMQLLFSAEARQELLRDYAAALGLIWRQDAVAVSFFHAKGAHLAVVISRSDSRPMTGAQMERFYQVLYEHDVAKNVTVGFTEYDGKMVFVNLSGAQTDEIFWQTLASLAERFLPHDVFLDFARADLELESSDWSVDHGESYRQRPRKSGRSALLQWIEAVARPQAEEFIRNFDWAGKGQKRSKKSRDSGKKKRRSG